MPLERKERETMSDDNKTTETVDTVEKVTVEQILALATERGAVVKEQKAFFKLTSSDKNKKALYISRTKNGLTRLDIAGFEPGEHVAIKSLTAEGAKEMKLGAVRGQVLPKELRCGSDMILEAVNLCLDGLLDSTEGFKLIRKPVEESEVVAMAADEAPSYDPYPVIFLRSARAG